MQHSILFVVHAGEGIGLGHLTRSLVAARSLVLRLGAHIDFVAVGQTIDDRLIQDFKVHFVVRDGPIDVVIDRLRKNNHYAAICLDLYEPALLLNLGIVLESARKTGCKIVAIDSLCGFEDHIDLLYVPSFVPAPKPKGVKFRGRLAYGWDAYLLNIQAKAKEERQDPSGSILALTGGSDVMQLGRDWPAILNQHLPSGSLVDWVTGPFSKRPIFPESSNVKFVEHDAPTGLTSLMQGALAAVTVYGVSFFELIALGVPTVVFSPYGGRYSSELRGISEHRIALVAQDATDAADQVARLMKDSHLRAELSCNARDKMKNFDGEYFAAELKLLLTT